MNQEHRDLLIIGGGVGGVICLKYARQAGIDALVLERQGAVGGLWCVLPDWQDIQFRKEDWTIGDLPIRSEKRQDIQANIQSWVDAYQLGRHIRLGTEVTSLSRRGDAWEVDTAQCRYSAKFVVLATGVHNAAVFPPIARAHSAIVEYHSSQLNDPGALSGREVVVVGGGASAFDLLDLALSNGASAVHWVYRRVKWMSPTVRAKYSGTDMRMLARMQVLGVPIERMNRMTDEKLRVRYRRFGIEAIVPQQAFDFRRDQLVPGRPAMIREFARIHRHVSEPASIDRNELRLRNGDAIRADTVLWATGYRPDFSYLRPDELAQEVTREALARDLRSLFCSAQANLFLLAPAVLESNGATPFGYCHGARAICGWIQSGRLPRPESTSNHNVNYFELPMKLASWGTPGYSRITSWLRHFRLAFLHPRALPVKMP
jgi:hypothetical protein